MLRIVWDFANNPYVAGILLILVSWLLTSTDFLPYPLLSGIVKLILTLGMFLFSVCLIMAFIKEINRHRVLTPEEKFHSMLPELRSSRDVLAANVEKLPFNNIVALTPDEYDAFARVNDIFTRFEIQRISEELLKKGRSGIPLILIYVDTMIRYAEEKNLATALRLAEFYKPSFDE